MPQEWNPKAPDLGQGFDAAKENAPPEPEQTPEKVQGIATKAELEMREKERSMPVREQHLTIGGQIERASNQKTHDENEERIRYLERRLARRNLKRDFDRSR